MFLYLFIFTQVDFIPNVTENESFETFKLEEPIHLIDMDSKKVVLEFNELTFIQLWSYCCGSEPEVWEKARDIEAQFKNKGLRTISINFENGVGFKEQVQRVKEVLEEREPPNEIYMDRLGYAYEILRAKGFPSYFLVNANDEVLFYTNGKVEEGVQALIDRIHVELGQ